MMNRLSRLMRWCMVLASGGVLFQVAGCDLASALQVLDTIFLGVLAGAGYVVIKNV
ncbi:MAG TPA: hypothetical protein PLC79_06650 [Phycisphaerae bacterium]|nr:hypothetical protein [Phycisphaerae bacterium]